MKAKVYIETTIPSYLAARPSRDLIVAAHQEITWEWWDKRRADFDVYISQFVVDEASGGDPEVATRRLQFLGSLLELEVTENVAVLVEAFIREGAIPAKAAVDGAHIAVAALHDMDFLLTWNCKHIANAEMFSMIGAVCKTYGYDCPVICTPEELLGE